MLDTDIHHGIASIPVFEQLTYRSLGLPKQKMMLVAVSVLIADARLYDLPRAKCAMIIDNGHSLERTSIFQIAYSFLAENGSRAFQG